MKQTNKKILMVFVEPTPYILDLIEKGFANYKNKLKIIFLTENLTQNWNLKSYSIPFVIIKSRKQKLTLLFSIFFKRKYNLIHVAGWVQPFILFLIFTSRFFFLPVIIESDTPLNQNTSNWKGLIKRCIYPLLFKFPVFFLPGGTRQEKYFSYYGVKSKKMVQAKMTVDVAYITKYVSSISVYERKKLRLQYNALNDDLVFLFVGRLVKWKGISELISAVELLEDTRAKLWIVGSGELTSEVELATQNSERIMYLGRLSGDLLLRIYHAADVFVLASYAEPWGLVINEAMAAGLPIIATNTIGCIDDLVFQNNHGIIIQPRNIISLSNAMHYMLKNPEKRKLMAENASAHIANWTLQNEAKNVITSWEKCLNSDFSCH